MRRLRRTVVGWSVAAFVALWGVVYLSVRGDDSLASTSNAATSQTNGDTGSSSTQAGDDSSSAVPDDGGFWSDNGSAQAQLPPASTSQS